MNQKTLNVSAFRYALTLVLFLSFFLMFLSSCGVMRRGSDGCPSTNIAPARASYRGR